MTKNQSKTRKILALLVAAVAVLAIAPGAASAKVQKVHAQSSVWMQYQPASTGVAKPFIFGGVSSDRGACENRTIQIARMYNNDPNTWDYVWGYQEVTHADSGFTRYLELSDRGYQYTAWVGKKVVKKGNKKIVCDYAETPDLLYAN